MAILTTSTFNFNRKKEQTFDQTACSLVVASRRVHQLVRKLQEWESLLNVFRIHVEMPRGGQLSKTRAPEPPAGRFPKFLLPRAAGRTQKLKYDLCIPSPTPVRVVGGEWKSVGSRWNQDFPGLHMAASQAQVCQSAAGAPQKLPLSKRLPIS